MENIRQAMNDGAFDFATKPIDMDDLARTIEKAIKQIDFIHEAQKEHTLLESLKEDLTAARPDYAWRMSGGHADYAVG